MIGNPRNSRVGRLDLELLAGFLAVVDDGSVKGAAERLGLTPSGVSMQLKRLEDRIGGPLMERRGRRIELTAQGRTLLPYARRIVGLAEQARSRLSAPTLSGPLRVGLPEWIAGAGLERALARFKRAHPLVRLEVRADSSLELRAGVQTGQLDVALVIVDTAAAPRLPIVHREPLVWVVGDDALLDLQTDMPLALFECPCPFRSLATERLGAYGWHGVEVFTSKSVASIQAAVEAGLGISVLPRSAVRPGLRVLCAQDGFPELPATKLGLCRASGLHSDAADHLGAYLRDALAPPGTARRE